MPSFHIPGDGDPRIQGLTMDDVTLRPQRLTRFRSRREVDLQPRQILREGVPARRLGVSNGIWLANMNTVAGRRSSIVAALYGGLAVLPQDMDNDTIHRIVGEVKNADTWCEPALTVDPDTKLSEVIDIIKKMSHDLVVVVEDGKPVGVISVHDYMDRDNGKRKKSKHTTAAMVMREDVKSLVRPKEITDINRDESYRDAFYQLNNWNLKSAPVVDEDGFLVGVMTQFFAAMHARSNAKPNLPPVVRHPSLDDEGRLMVAVALGVNHPNIAEQAEWLYSLGVDVVVIDTAHGHSDFMIDRIQLVRKRVGQEPFLAAGNVGTAQGAHDLIEAGADIVKVGIGPGAVCTTRVTAGVGCPQLDTVLECSSMIDGLGGLTIADGGIKEPGHLGKLEAAGGAFFMIGSMAAGVYESPGDVETDDSGREYKDNAGMASRESVDGRNEGHRDPLELVIRQQYVEGASGRTYIHPDRPHLGALFVWLLTGQQSGRSYSNAQTQDQMYDGAVLQAQTGTGRHEGTPNGKQLNG